jgi:hypothetical protein
MRVLLGERAVLAAAGERRTGEGCCLVHGALSGNNGRVDRGPSFRARGLSSLVLCNAGVLPLRYTVHVDSVRASPCRVESKATSVRATAPGEKLAHGSRLNAHFFGPWATNEHGLIALADFKAHQSDMTIGTTACV